MHINRKDLLWMLGKVNGQRVDQDKLRRVFTSHGIPSFLPYIGSIAVFYDRFADKSAVMRKLIPALCARVNHDIKLPHDNLSSLNFHELEETLGPLLIKSLKQQDAYHIDKGARVIVRGDSKISCVQPGSEGFVTEQSDSESTVKFYSSPGRYTTDLFSATVPTSELQNLNLKSLLDRHQNLEGIAHYYSRDALMRSMKSRINSALYADAADLALRFLLEEGFVFLKGSDFIGVPERIFHALAPRLDATYHDSSLFSTHSLSSPPSERKPHVLRLELTTGCDYNQCTFCSEYTGMTAATKSFEQFKDHTDRVVESIGSEKAEISRLFFGSGNSLGVKTGLLLKALNYASELFAPKRISLYGRTASILEKSLADLKKLKEAGLTLIYWGLESGSDDVLNYICKDCTRSDMIEASKRLAEAEIESSAMLMPGAGGLHFSEQHVAGTLELLHNIEIDYLTLLSINPADNSAYTRKMATEPDNRPLTSDEVNAQIYKLLEGLNYPDLKINMFTEEVDQLSSNTRRFNYTLTASNKELLLREFENADI